MRLLLDSHTLLWYVGDRALLSRRVRELLDDEANELFVSIASLWELAIKVAKGKLALPGNSVSSLLEQIDLLGIALLHMSL